MTAVAPEVGIDLNRPQIPFGRLVGVELRKMYDTRAGKWLLGTIGAINLLVMVIVLWVSLATDSPISFPDFIVAMVAPLSILLPVLGVLSVTSEWSQRTALVTFALVPHRGRVVLAKVVAGVVIAFAATVAAVVAAVLGTLLLGAFGSADASWGDPSAGMFTASFLMMLLPVLMGLAYGMLLLSSPGAIVLYFAAIFVLPGIFGTAAVFLDWFNDIWRWIDFGTTQSILMQSTISGEEWAQFAVSGTLWIIVPFVFGTLRVLRSEIK